MRHDQRKRFHAICTALGIRDAEQKKGIILQWTDGKTDSTTQMDEALADQMNQALDAQNKKKGGRGVTQQETVVDPLEKERTQRMRSKILYLACACGFGTGEVKYGREQINWERFNVFMLKYSKHKKALNKYAYNELPELVSQLEYMEVNIKKTGFNKYLKEVLKELEIKTTSWSRKKKQTTIQS